MINKTGLLSLWQEYLEKNNEFMDMNQNANYLSFFS